MDIKALHQHIIEDRYSKENIHNWVKQDLIESGLEEELKQGEDLLYDYCMGKYWDSKNERIDKLLMSNWDYQDLVLEVFTVIIPEDTQTIQTVCGRLAEMLPVGNIFSKIQTAAEIVGVLEPLGLYRIISASESDTDSILVESLIELEDETIQKLADTKYLPPMIVPPRTVTGNDSPQYLTKKKDNLVLNAPKNWDADTCIGVVNICNQIALELDENILQYEEKPNKECDTPEKIKAFELLRNSSKKVYKELLEYGNEFYFAWKFDRRGRMYSQGYHVNVQSTEYKKAIINLKRKEVITC